MERSTLEKYDYLINDIGRYLATNISVKHRFKQSVDNLSKIKNWALSEDKVFHKSNEIADGVDLSELKQNPKGFKGKHTTRERKTSTTQNTTNQVSAKGGSNTVSNSDRMSGLKTQVLRENLIQESSSDYDNFNRYEVESPGHTRDEFFNINDNTLADMSVNTLNNTSFNQQNTTL
jgi:hypothetical protein